MPLCAALTALVLFFVADAWLKHAPHPGFAPAAAWTVYAPDARRAWDAFQDHAPGPALFKELGGPLQDAQLAARLALGVRPTPERFRRWCGPGVLAWGSHGEVGGCIRPGVLMRAAAFFHRHQQDADGIREHGGVFYVWRDGYVLLSRSRPFLLESMAKAAPYVPARSVDESGMLLEWGRGSSEADATGQVVIQGEAGWPLEGRLNLKLGESNALLELHQVWPETPLAALHVLAPEDLQICADYAARLPLPRPVAPPWFGAMKDAVFSAWPLEETIAPFFDGASECGLAWMDLDTRAAVPIPSAACAARKESQPLSSALTKNISAAGGFPHEWHGLPGYRIPYLGEAFAVCFAARGGTAYGTTNSGLMSDLLGHVPDAVGFHASLFFTVDAAQLAKHGIALARRAAELELLSRQGPRDFERSILPWINAMAKLGRIEIIGESVDGGLKIKGRFLSPQGISP